ncbi:MAG: hypothetical protein IJF12_05235 [Alphaproteobacteria bacterium]|nr:hypothetical protein [Alphaproteobacteria bacterium]
MDSINQNLQNRTPNEQSGDNRPRLRKIKRPKQHNGPIQQNRPYPNDMAQTPYNQPTGDDDFMSAPQENMPVNNALIRGEEREVYNQEYNNFNAPEYVTDAEEDTFVYQGNANTSHHMMFDNKKVLIIACVCVLIGLILGNFMFSSKTVVRDGLQGVIVNPEVPKGRSRCGIAEKTQGCVLYIMNPQRNELNGRDFYDLAAQLTGRQRFVIETGNMRYSTVKIKPGNIAQLNIPPLQ